MKKLHKILKSLIVFLVITTAVYAVDQTVLDHSYELKKIVVLGIGIFFVVQILWISYKADLLEESNGEIKIVQKNIFPQKEENLQQIKREEEILFSQMNQGKSIETIEKENISKEQVKKETASSIKTRTPRPKTIEIKKRIAVAKESARKENKKTKKDSKNNTENVKKVEEEKNKKGNK